jgi:acid phosphatase family membrane protein YuiD
MFLGIGDNIEKVITTRAMQVLIISVISMLLAQLIKFVVYSIRYKKPCWRLLASTGGFPSSHTSFCVALCISLGMLQWRQMNNLDWSFAVAVVFSAITIHDAYGVRFEASKHAIILNNLTEDLTDEERKELGFGKKGKLKEMLGHKVTEVLGGIVVGIVVGIVGFFICA